VWRQLAGGDALVDVGAILAQAAEGSSGGVADWPDVYIAFLVVPVTDTLAGAAALADVRIP
jgi:hypothetical protein